MGVSAGNGDQLLEQGAYLHGVVDGAYLHRVKLVSRGGAVDSMAIFQFSCIEVALRCRC